MLNRHKGTGYFMCVIGKVIRSSLRTEALALREGVKQSLNNRAILVFMELLRSLISATQPKPRNDGFIGNVDCDDDEKISSKAVI